VKIENPLIPGAQLREATLNLTPAQIDEIKQWRELDEAGESPEPPMGLTYGEAASVAEFNDAFEAGEAEYEWDDGEEEDMQSLVTKGIIKLGPAAPVQ
jgi:hypothetical protein